MGNSQGAQERPPGKLVKAKSFMRFGGKKSATKENVVAKGDPDDIPGILVGGHRKKFKSADSTYFRSLPEEDQTLGLGGKILSTNNGNCELNGAQLEVQPTAEPRKSISEHVSLTSSANKSRERGGAPPQQEKPASLDSSVLLDGDDLLSYNSAAARAGSHHHNAADNDNNTHEPSILFVTDSWKKAQTISAREIVDKPSELGRQTSSSSNCGSFIVVREQTTSSSSDSIFTDAQTPLGFTAELNQCYYSEEDVCDSTQGAEDVKGGPFLSALVARTNPDLLTKLTVARLSPINVTGTVVAGMAQEKMRKGSSCTEEERLAGALFNVSRVKRVELIDNLAKFPDPNLPTSACCSPESDYFSPRDVPLPPTPITPPATRNGDPQSPSDGSVLKKVASLISAERLQQQQTPLPERKASFVPEKLNFGAYEKFEGQMLMNWLVTSMQPLTHLSDQDIHTICHQACTNLLVAGVIKQISDRLAPIQEAFRTNLMYQWTHTEAPPATPVTPGRLDPSAAWPHIEKPTPKDNNNDDLQELKSKISACDSVSEMKALVEEKLTEKRIRRNLSNELSDQQQQVNGIEEEKKKTTEDVAVQTDFDVLHLKKITISATAPKSPVQSPVKAAAPPLPPPMPPPPPVASFPDHVVNGEMETKAVIPPPPPPPQLIPGPPLPPPLPSGSISAAPPCPPVPPPLAPPAPADTSKPGGPGPVPFPLPPTGGWQQSYTLRKSAVNPPKPMKPLYWTRIVAPKSPVEDQQSPSNLLWAEIDEVKLDNLDEFTELFSRQAVIPKAKETPKITKVRSVKVLDAKRSQNVAIFVRSLHADFAEIEHAINHCDTSVISLQALQVIRDIRATSEEIAQIREAAQEDSPLDEPEQFLLRLEDISSCTERIGCIVFQAEFDEAITLLARKIDVFTDTCSLMVDSDNLKNLFSIILTLGNYMNGGNRTRGQADGFGLEILGKLKDVKSKDSRITLLHFIVKTYIAECRKNGTPLMELQIPIPEAADISVCATVDFEDLTQQLERLEKKLKECKETSQRVIESSSPENVQPFEEKMKAFLNAATDRLLLQKKDVKDSRKIFSKVTLFYKFTPKSGSLEDPKPEQFFEMWLSFANDFKDIWKREIQDLTRELLKKTKPSPKATKAKAKKVVPGSLKDRMQKFSSKLSS